MQILYHLVLFFLVESVLTLNSSSIENAETARNLNNLKEQSVKLLNFNINNYLANLNRLNNPIPMIKNEQLAPVISDLIKKKKTLGQANLNLINPISSSTQSHLIQPKSTYSPQISSSTVISNLNAENELPIHWKLLITGMQKFSLNLLRSLHNFEPKDSSSGIIISPFSIWSTLLVAYMGAKNETEREIGEVLCLKNIPKLSVLQGYKGLKEWYDERCKSSSKIKNSVENNQTNSTSDFCSLANRIYFNSNLKLNKFLKDNFKEETQSMDFINEVERSRLEINKWIEFKTKNKIKNLIAPGSINSFTNIIVANAIFFQSKWLTKFDAQKTIKGKFQVNPTEEIIVNYMRQTANFMYGISENIKSSILELPYSSQEFSMILILPDPQMGIDSLIKLIRVTHLEEIFSNLYDDEIEVQIPKFKFEQEFELAGPLYSLGMKRIFDPRFSDFSGFLEQTSNLSTNNSSLDNEINDINNNIKEDFFNNKTNQKVIINSVIHKAFISTDEEGTEAAAATAMLIARSGRPAFPSQFIANRPFLFLIRDTTINAISFMGIVRRPLSE